MTEKKNLFLLDAFALIYRGYFAFIKNPQINSKGIDISAVIGFTNTLINLIKREKPEYLAVVFDTPEQTFRHEQFSDYKAHREAMPEGIRIGLPYISQILEAFNIPQIYSPGYEADDVIGTLAKKAEKQGFTTYMMTPDKDYAQLVSENIFMYKPARIGNSFEILGIEEVCEKFEIEKVEQVIDLLGMMGDSSDNIPGLPGVGEKTAKKFIKEYGSMENLFNNLHKLKGKQKEKIEQNIELGLQSKQLATIIIDVPVELEEEKLIMSEPNFNALFKIFEELEFKRLTETVKTIFASYTKTKETSNKITQSIQTNLFEVDDTETETTAEGLNNINNTTHHYQLIDTPILLNALISKILKQKSVCFDTETTSLNTFDAELVGISFAWQKNKAYYVSIPENESQKYYKNYCLSLKTQT